MHRTPLTSLVIAGLLVSGCAEEDVEPPRPRLEIFVDDNGIPHIYGRTDADAFYGAGYQMATDRLFHMETTRRRAYGTLSEVLGQEALADDELSRLFDFSGWGMQHANKMQAEAPDLHALITTWTDGVNARIAEVRDGMATLPHGFGPAEFDFLPEPWAVHDVMTIATMTGFGNDLVFDAEAFAAIAYKLYPEEMGKAELFRPARNTFTTVYEEPRSGTLPTTQRNAPTQEPLRPPVRDVKQTMDTLIRLNRMRTGMGSNNWAVDGQHTESGRPLIAGDPHQDWNIPGVFYALHINSKDQEGTINAAGFSFVGTPGVSVGQTDRIVWTPTTAFADTMDVWTVQNPDPDSVIIGGQSYPITHHEEIIKVRGEGDPVGEGNDTLYVVDTVEGQGVILPTSLVPIPLGEDGDILMVNWAGFVPNAFSSLLDFNRVQSIDEYEEAVLGFGANFNFVAADANGITHRVGTKIPRRNVSEERKPWLVLDADDPASLWTGEFLTPEELPHGRGGNRGYVVTANNDPYGFTQDGDLTNDPFYFGSFFAPAWRANRAEGEIAKMVAERDGTLTLEDMQTVQQDLHSNIGDDLIPILESAMAELGSNAALAEFEGRADVAALAAALSAWDREMRADSPEALILFAYAQMLTKLAIGDDIDLVFQQAMELQPIFIMKIAIMTMRGEYAEGDDLLQEGRSYVAIAALAEVADFLTERYGGVELNRYSLGSLRISHMDGSTGRGLDRGKFATSGFEDTVAVAAWNSFFDANLEVLDETTSVHGPIFRHTSTFSEDGTPEIYFNMPLGNVAEPTSSHYEDLHSDWMTGGYRKFWYTRQEVLDHSESSFTLLDEDES